MIVYIAIYFMLAFAWSAFCLKQKQVITWDTKTTEGIIAGAVMNILLFPFAFFVCLNLGIICEIYGYNQNKEPYLGDALEEVEIYPEGTTRKVTVLGFTGFKTKVETARVEHVFDKSYNLIKHRNYWN